MSDESIDKYQPLKILITLTTMGSMSAMLILLPEGRFIIVMVYGCRKQSRRNYTAKVVKKVEGGYEVEFDKRKIPSNRFIRTNEELHSSPEPM